MDARDSLGWSSYRSRGVQSKSAYQTALPFAYGKKCLRTIQRLPGASASGPVTYRGSEAPLARSTEPAGLVESGRTRAAEWNAAGCVCEEPIVCTE